MSTLESLECVWNTVNSFFPTDWAMNVLLLKVQYGKLGEHNKTQLKQCYYIFIEHNKNN
jgi:hypothetical protein